MAFVFLEMFVVVSLFLKHILAGYEFFQRLGDVPLSSCLPPFDEKSAVASVCPLHISCLCVLADFKNFSLSLILINMCLGVILFMFLFTWDSLSFLWVYISHQILKLF